jgi:branched-chain amino acid transport system permease protein
MLKAQTKTLLLIFLAFMLLPILHIFDWQVVTILRPILIFSFLALGLHLIAGLTGILHLGLAGMMAIGAYVYAILTCEIYPFQFNFIAAVFFVLVIGCLVGGFLGGAVLRLKGDYLAIVTLAFGEIIQDFLRNMEEITRGMQGINPIPAAEIFGVRMDSSSPALWYYFLLALLAVVTILIRNLEIGRFGRMWRSVRDDELSSSCFGISPVKTKLLAFGLGSALAAFSGALWATHLGSTGEPGNYDFQISVICLCALIVGGLGTLPGVFIGVLLIVGLNSIVLTQISEFLSSINSLQSQNVFLTPNNYKYALYGLVLIFVMRKMPQGLLGSSSQAGKA